MRVSKSAVKKTTSRKEVSKAIATQDAETKRSGLSADQLQEAIRIKAYELYLQRGGQHGNDAQDWIEAERIVLA